MRASRRLWMAIAALFGLGLLAGTWQALHEPWPDALGLLLWGLVLAVGVLALVDAALVRRLPAIAVRRDLPGRLHAGEDYRVELSLRHGGRRPLTVQVHDPLPPGMATQPLRHEVIVTPGQPATAGYSLQALQRGRWTLGQCAIRLTSPLGLWHLRRLGATPQQVDVYPALLDGSPPRPTAGTEESRWPLILVFDGSQSPGRSRPEAFERALAAGLRLGQVAIGQGEAVGLLTFMADSLEYLPPRKGPAQWRALLDALQAVEPDRPVADCRAGAEALLRHHPRRARVVWLRGTDDQDPAALLGAIAALRRYHQVLLVNPCDEAIEPLRQRPVETLEQALAYYGAMQRLAAQTTLQAQVGALGALWLETSSAQAGEQLVRRYLAWKQADGA